MKAPAGYSGTPLIKKLGITPEYRCLAMNAPQDYAELLGSPEWLCMDTTPEGRYSFIHAFFSDRDALLYTWKTLKDHLEPDGMLWISWPKGSSQIPKNLNENDVRSIGLEGGLVDVKICAVDADWSGLKFMYRRKDR